MTRLIHFCCLFFHKWTASGRVEMIWLKGLLGQCGRLLGCPGWSPGSCQVVDWVRGCDAPSNQCHFGIVWEKEHIFAWRASEGPRTSSWSCTLTGWCPWSHHWWGDLSVCEAQNPAFHTNQEHWVHLWRCPQLLAISLVRANKNWNKWELKLAELKKKTRQFAKVAKVGRGTSTEPLDRFCWNWLHTFSIDLATSAGEIVDCKTHLNRRLALTVNAI